MSAAHFCEFRSDPEKLALLLNSTFFSSLLFYEGREKV